MRARGFSWGSAARVALPRWRSVAMIELTLVVVVIALVSASLMGAALQMLAKVRLMEALSYMHVGRVDVAEHYAVTGRALPTNMLGRESGSDATSVPEYEKHLSAAAAFAAVGSASGQQSRTEQAWKDSSSYYTRAGVVDGAVVGIGRVRGVERPYRLSLSAADTDQGAPMLLWTCGAESLPPGFRAIGTRVPDEMPQELLIYPCRRSRPW